MRLAIDEFLTDLSDQDKAIAAAVENGADTFFGDAVSGGGVDDIDPEGFGGVEELVEVGIGGQFEGGVADFLVTSPFDGAEAEYAAGEIETAEGAMWNEAHSRCQWRFCCQGSWPMGACGRFGGGSDGDGEDGVSDCSAR